MLKIAIGSDHGGYDAKEEIKNYLISKGYEVLDCGTNSKDSCNYAIFGHFVADAVKDGKTNYGVVICTSGEGIMMSANKVTGVRCGLGYNDEVSELMRKHNDANIIAFGAKFMSTDDMKRRIDIFLATEFEGGRHVERVNSIEK